MNKDVEMYTDLGKQIVEMVLPLYISIAESARQIGVARQTLSNILRGEQALTPKIMAKMAMVFMSTKEEIYRDRISIDLLSMQAEMNYRKQLVKYEDIIEVKKLKVPAKHKLR